MQELQLTYLNKLAVLRIAVDLVKADSRIHGDEISLLAELQEKFALSQEDLDRIHYITLQQAVSSLKELDVFSAEHVVRILEEVMCVDNEIDYEENILLTAVFMSISPRSRDWCDVLSVPNVMDETSLRQVLYLESSPCPEVHKLFNDKYDKLLITKSFNDMGLDFFYLPDVLRGHQDGSDSMVNLLRQAMRYLVPSGTGRIDDADIASFSPEGFFYFLLSRYRIDLKSLKSQSFLLFKVRDSYSLDDDNNLTKGVDFFVISMDADVKSRIYTFISRFDKQNNQIPYEGCYKILCDYLSSASKNVSRILVDDSYGFSLMDNERTKVVFESSPQTRTFYLLLLRYGAAGVSQDTFDEALRLLSEVPDQEDFSMEGFMSRMRSICTEASHLIYNACVIYSEVSGKETSSRKFLGYIESIFRNRSSLKNYANKGFFELNKLADADKFLISFDSSAKTYGISAELQTFRMRTLAGTDVTLDKTDFWQRLL
ncbi:MAG: TerB family tellurite resistance protein [Bacteroidales bacterium]|nr:TerB family tellurite resistance protein [Bacteroidales bacterium]